MPWDIIVIGAGAAGLLAAARAGERGLRTLLLEKNPHAGVKILMSGGTRCNITQATDKRGIIQAYGDQGPFLHSALALLDPPGVVQLFEDEGVATKVEETGKIFPVSDKASDVLAALVRRLQRSGAELALDEAVTDMQLESALRRNCGAGVLPADCSITHAGETPAPQPTNGFVVTTVHRTLHANKLIVTVGGKSYPGCGTSGDGYAWLAAFGHTIVPPRPALTPVTTHAEWVRELKGVTMPDVFVRVLPADAVDGPAGQRRKHVLAERRGSLLFTHFGLSGPVVLDVSRVISGHPQPHSLVLVCDFCPDVSVEQLDEALRRDAIADGKKQIVGLLLRHVPRRLAETLLVQSGVTPTLRAAELSKRDRLRLVEAIKQLRIPVAGTMGFRKAEVTAGGVALDEVDSHTMQSKLVPNLYLAGEILDLDGPIGGYNFQAAFSTGMLAGESV